MRYKGLVGLEKNTFDLDTRSHHISPLDCSLPISMARGRPQAERRLSEGRPTAIDMIAKNLHLQHEFDFDLVDPWKVGNLRGP